MKDVLDIVGLTIGFWFIIAVLFVAGGMPSSNYKAWKFEQALKSGPHLDNSTILERFRMVANLGGASNGCDYAAGEIRATDLSKKEVLKFYKPYIHDRFHEIPTSYFGIHFLDESNEYIPLEVREKLDALMRSYTGNFSKETIYLELATEEEHPAGADLRCH